MSEIKLLPCPFCGKGFRINSRGGYEHDNENCPLHGLEIGTEEQQKKWNTRKPMERIIERLEERHLNHVKNIFKYQEVKDFDSCSRTSNIKVENEISIEIVKEECRINN